jgi:hypothetical protein
MPNLSKTIEELDWVAIGQMRESQLRQLLLLLYNLAVDENMKKRRSSEIGALKRKYKYKR